MKKIHHSNIVDWFNDLSIILFGFIFGTIIVLITGMYYLSGSLSFLLFRAILFIYILSIIMISLRVFFINLIKKLAHKLGFELITPFYMQPRIQGTYNKNWWQIHFVSKETGKDPGVLRTYIKLQFKKPKKFDEDKLKKYKNFISKNCRILTIKHIVRPHKNYLLLKRSWFTFNEKDIKEMMDLLLKVSKEAEIK